MSGATEPVRYPVLGVGVHAVDAIEARDIVLRWVADGERAYACLAAVHGIMECRRDPTLRAVYNAAGLCLPDGMPLVWVGRLQGARVGRVYGPDLTLALCERAAALGHSVYFHGGAEGVAEALAGEMSRRFPGLRVAGFDSPPFRKPTAAEDDALVARINAGRPDIVFVGLGCPKQERWMAEHRQRLEAAALLGVGAAFEFHTGRVAQAPRALQAVGLEWLFRLLNEPRRLWYRYLVYNPLFVALMALQWLGWRRFRALPDVGATRTPGRAAPPSPP
jgi:N-acetylglucosaminyldiphosphoundecaprenol N-acetyl-beta-D-mannosaminyltransferase